MARSIAGGAAWRRGIVMLAATAAGSSLGWAEGFEAAVQAGLTRSSEFEESDAGFGARLAWRASSSFALEAELNLRPGDLGEPAFSASRREALAGVKLGRSVGRAGLFATLRAGLVDFAEAPEPFPCILIFPPPLACRMAQGETVPALGFGAGVEVTSDRTVLRLDVGDQMLKYPGPVLAAGREAREDGFWDHDLRVMVGLGWRF